MAGQELSLEPVKVLTDVSNKISATRTHFGEYSSGVSKLLKLKDEILHKAVTRTPLSTQQLTNIAVVSSSLFLSKTAIEEKLSSVSSLAASSVKQAEVLPSRALLHWMLLATKLLRRLHVSEHLQLRYRTARMLEIWDLAASSMPASPNLSPRPLASKYIRSRAKPGAATSIPQAPSPPPLARLASPTPHSRPTSPSKTSPTTTQSVADVGRGQSLAGGSGRSKAAGSSPQPIQDFPSLPSFVAASATAAALNTARLQPVPPQLQSAAGVFEAPAASSSAVASARQPQDKPLLQINPAQLSRSSSHAMSSPRVVQPDTDHIDVAHAISSSNPAAIVAATPGFLGVVDTNAEGLGGLPSAYPGPTTAVAGMTAQDMGTSDLLAAVNAVARRLSLPRTASQSSYAGLPSIGEASAATYDTIRVSAAQQPSDTAAAAAAAESRPSDGFMVNGAAAGFRRTISNLRTGAVLTASVAADLPRVASMSGQSYRPASHDTQLPACHMQGRVSGAHDGKQQDTAILHGASNLIALTAFAMKELVEEGIRHVCGKQGSSAISALS